MTKLSRRIISIAACFIGLTVPELAFGQGRDRDGGGRGGGGRGGGGGAAARSGGGGGERRSVQSGERRSGQRGGGERKSVQGGGAERRSETRQRPGTEESSKRSAVRDSDGATKGESTNIEDRSSQRSEGRRRDDANVGARSGRHRGHDHDDDDNFSFGLNFGPFWGGYGRPWFYGSPWWGGYGGPWGGPWGGWYGGPWGGFYGQNFGYYGPWSGSYGTGWPYYYSSDYTTDDEVVIARAYRDPNSATAESESPRGEPAKMTTREGLEFQNRAEQAFRAGRYDEAVRLANHAAVEMPRNGKLFLFMSQALFAVGDYGAASAAAHQGLGLSPEKAWGSVVSDFRQYYSGDDYTAQLRRLEKFVSENKDAAFARFLLGYHYGFLGYEKEARAELEAAIELEERDQLAGHLLERFGGPPVERKESERARPMPDSER